MSRTIEMFASECDTCSILIDVDEQYIFSDRKLQSITLKGEYFHHFYHTHRYRSVRENIHFLDCSIENTTFEKLEMENT